MIEYSDTKLTSNQTAKEIILDAVFNARDYGLESCLLGDRLTDKEKEDLNKSLIRQAGRVERLLRRKQ